MSEKQMPFQRLADLFTLSGLLADHDGDGLPESVRAKLVLGAGAGLPEQRAAVDLAARLGFETLALRLPLAFWDPRTVDDEHVPVFIGRPGTLASHCLRSLAGVLAALQPAEGLVALASEPRPALLVGGADEQGLAAAVRALVADRLAIGEPLATTMDLEAIRVGIDTTPLASEDGATDEALPPLRSLAGLFGPAGLALDSDGDLLPDQPRARLVLPDDLSPVEAVAVVHLAARLGLEALGLALPLVVTGDEDALPRVGQVRIVAEPLSTLPSSTAVGRIRLQTEGSGQVIRIAGDAKGRAAALEELVRLDAWTLEEQPTLEAIERALNRLCTLVDPGTSLCAAMPAIRQLPALLDRPREATLTAEECGGQLPEHGGSPGDHEDQKSRAKPAGEEVPFRLQVCIPAAWSIDHAAVATCVQHWLRQALHADDCTVEVATVSPAVLIDETQSLPWEMDEAWQWLREEVVPALAALPEGSAGWSLDLRLSEPEGRRRALKQTVLREIRDAGQAADDAQVRVLPAYHQGRAWLLEEVLPLLHALPVTTLRVRVQRFVPDTPSLELPIRWLQDLFPVDELLAERLGLPLTAIQLELVEDLATTYEVAAYDAGQNLLLRRTFDVVYAARPYLQDFPEWGMVHPPTGCLRLVVNGEMRVDRRLPTDPERVWDYVQGMLLPRLATEIRAACGGAPRRERQPFFGELAIDVWLSEEDEPLGVREERSSPLECLHEDLYFTLLDYCTALISGASDETPYVPPWLAPAGEDRPRRDARRWTAPGRIVPRIHRRDGAAGRVQVRLTTAEPQPSLLWRHGEMTGMLPLSAAPAATVRIVGIDVPAEGDGGAAAPRLLLALDGPADACEHARGILTGWGDLRAANAGIEIGVPPSWAFVIEHQEGQPGETAGDAVFIPAESAGHNRTRAAPHSELEESTDALPCARTAGTVVPWDRVLGLRDIEEQARRLGQLPGVHAFQVGRSARGRPVWAMELTVPRAGGWWSRARLSGWKCTLLLNARHHANEPASTSALLRLGELLAEDETWHRYLRRVNVVLIPGENVDGMGLYERLQDEHPTWMHHAARYNAAGLEYASAYANPATVHTEALVLPLLWRRWAPDIVCDNHGFPAHAWEQLFAGQGNPWYRAFWIPQALIYAYLPEARSPRFPQHGEAASAIAASLVDALAADRRIAIWNADHAERYRTFLHAWLPDRFPAAYDRDVLIHRSSYDPEGSDTGQAGFPGAYPGVTTASLVTEVADETAQGDYLALCAGAHLLADRVLLQYLFDADGPAQVRSERRIQRDGSTLLRATRPRPVRLAPPTVG